MSLTDGKCDICGREIDNGDWCQRGEEYVICYRCDTQRELKELRTDYRHIFYLRKHKGKGEYCITNHYEGFYFRLTESNERVGAEENDWHVKFTDHLGNHWHGQGTIGVETAITCYKDTTIVIFRRMKDGDIIALFPEIAADTNGNCQSYMHLGQHGAADTSLMRDTRKAAPDEYAELKKELEDIGYDLKIKYKMLPLYGESRMKDMERILGKELKSRLKLALEKDKEGG